jgi:hypothetical protein
MKIAILIIKLAMALQMAVCAQTWPAKTIPLHLAEDAVIAAQNEYPEDKQSRYGFIDSYCMAFLYSLRFGDQNTNVHLGYSDDARQKGYNAGINALREGSIGTSITPADFGYLIKDLEGEYHGGFEKSEFVVSTTGERYHLNKGNEKRIPAGNIKIRAYVSPESSLGYGHFNGWKREIIVIQVLDSENEGEQGVPGYRRQGAPQPEP